MQTEDEENSPTAKAQKPATRADVIRAKLKLVADYALDGFPPVAAAIAIIVAVIAINGNHSSQALLEKNTASLEHVNATVAAYKGELEQLKLALAQERNLRAEAENKQNAQIATVIQNISPLQVKLKVSPTLQEQLSQPASGVATAAPALASDHNKTSTQGQVLTEAIDKFNKKGHK